MYLGHQRLLYLRQIKISQWYLQQPAPAPIENHCVLPWRWITDMLLKNKSCSSRVTKDHLTKHSSWLNLEHEKTWPKNILWLWAQGIFPFGVHRTSWIWGVDTTENFGSLSVWENSWLIFLQILLWRNYPFLSSSGTSVLLKSTYEISNFSYKFLYFWITTYIFICIPVSW